MLQAFFFVLATPCNACNTNSLCKMTNHFLNLRTFVLLNAFSGCVIVEIYFCGSEQTWKMKEKNRWKSLYRDGRARDMKKVKVKHFGLTCYRMSWEWLMRRNTSSLKNKSSLTMRLLLTSILTQLTLWLNRKVSRLCHLFWFFKYLNFEKMPIYR